MPFRRWLNSVLDVLGLIGLTVRSDRRKDAWKSLEGRIWGPKTDGFALSIEARPATVRGNLPVKIAVALRNDSDQEVRETIASWLTFFELTVTGPDGRRLEPGEYGRNLIARSSTAGLHASFAPCDAVQNEIPVSEIYDVSRPGEYTVKASCPVPGKGRESRCESNEIRFRRIQ